ncbi:MAG TPA: hypothetical protein VG146_07980 [Verrucomicrobiae bacterium]|nr:hypothetical protein [Verrucomicrobiae bacterium]
MKPQRIQRVGPGKGARGWPWWSISRRSGQHVNQGQSVHWAPSPNGNLQALAAVVWLILRAGPY